MMAIPDLRPGYDDEDDDPSDHELLSFQREWKRHRVGLVSQCQVAASTLPSALADKAQLSAPSQEGHTSAGVEWLRFMAPEIKRVKALFADRPMLINTMCSGIGAPTTALQAPTALNNNSQCPHEHSNSPASAEITTHII